MIWTIAETAILLTLWILRRTVPGIPAAIPGRTAAGIPGRTRRRIAAGIKHTTAAGTIWITAAEISRLRQEKGRLLREDGLFLFHRKVRPMKQKISILRNICYLLQKNQHIVTDISLQKLFPV